LHGKCHMEMLHGKCHMENVTWKMLHGKCFEHALNDTEVTSSKT
jgi:hypothetical protein